jgi:hypothetical protein
VLYTTLPSGGKWYKTPVAYESEGEVAVYPTTAGDEILLKTPDALLNGVAIATMIKSCVPGIGDPWDAPTFDIDKLLVASRIASHGQMMEMAVVCPQCKEFNDYDADLSIMLDSFPTTVALDAPIEFKDIKIFVKPMTYKIATSINLLQFNNEKTLIGLREKDDQNAELHNELVTMSKHLAIVSMASCIERILMADGTVVDQYEFIKEFVTNADKHTYDQIKAGIDEKFAATQKVTDFDVVCQEEKCKCEFKVPFSFDTSNFFVFGS